MIEGVWERVVGVTKWFVEYLKIIKPLDPKYLEFYLILKVLKTI
jgi:hypothetical protein